jgi:trk system potassium uptake protein TrkA
MKVIIAGCGRQGTRLALLLEAEGHEVTVVDFQPSSFARLTEFGGTRIVGNCIDVDILKQAGIEHTDAFAAVTNGDNTNLMAAQIAKYLFNVPRVVSRVYDPARAGIYHDRGLDTVCATTVGARMIRNLIIAPKVLRTYQLGDGSVAAIEIKLQESIEGKTVRDAEIPEVFRISAVVRDQVPIVPDPDFILKNGDQVFGAVAAAGMEQLKERLGVFEYARNLPRKGEY